MAEVILKNVCKIYEGGVKAVNSVSIDIHDKEFMVLVGPSGCGKSTTLRMIAGLEEISDGEIKIGERVVNDVPPKDRDIAMVFQNYALYPHMTVYENLAFGLKLRKFSKEEIDKRVKEAADILGIGDYLQRKPKALSGGQRQRVAVGRAIVRKPAVFLFDEPLSNLDAKMRVQMRAEINKLHTRLGTTMIYVTHDQIEAMTMGDRICVMKDGVIQQIDTPLNIYDKPANTFVAGFIGTPPMNIFKGTLASEGGKFIFKAGPISIALPAEWSKSIEPYAGKEILFGIRPEDIGSERATNDASAPSITAKVEVREPMGAEIYLHLDTGVDAACIARVEPHLDAKVGETITLKLAMVGAHVFDPATTNRIIGGSLQASKNGNNEAKGFNA